MANHADEDSRSTVALNFEFAKGWPDEIRELYKRIFAVDIDDVEGQMRLGDLAFKEAPEAIEMIRSILRDLAEEPWGELPKSITNALHKQLSQLVDVLEKMVALSPRTSDNVQHEREELAKQLGGIKDWLRDNGRPHTLNARVRRAVEDQLREGQSPDLLERTHSAEEHLQTIVREIDSWQDVVSGLRQASGEHAGENLAGFFEDRASDLDTAAGAWMRRLLGMSAATVVVAVLLFFLLRPDTGATDAGSFAELTLGVFIVGILVFGIRVCAQQYRVSRHLEAVARAKEAALSTFTPFSASIKEAEVRSAVAAALAQAVFATEDTGLVDGSADHVTVVDRALAPLISRPGPSDVT